MIFKRHFLYLEILPILNLNNGHELGQTLGDGEGEGGLACCSPRSHKELDMTGPLNNNNNILCVCTMIFKRHVLYLETLPRLNLINNIKILLTG